MHAIQEWINNHLIEWGIISSSANELDNTIVLLLIIAGFAVRAAYVLLTGHLVRQHDAGGTNGLRREPATNGTT